MRLPFPFPCKLAALAAIAVAAGGLMAQLFGQYGGSGDPWWEAGSGRAMPMFSQFQDSTGDIAVINMEGPVETRNHPFFEDLGPNGRACITCHQPSSAMGLSADRLHQQWKDSRGLDPVFAAIDGSNCPTLPQHDPASHSLLLDRGLFRIYLPLPANAEFKVEVVRDPTGCNTSPVFGLTSPHPTISVFRRPRVVGNFKYIVADAPATVLAADGRDRTLSEQAAEAVHAHEQSGHNLTPAQLKKIVDFESQVYVAQVADNTGGDLTEVGGPLGAWALAYSRVPPQPSYAPIFLEAGYWQKAAGSQGRTPASDFRESVARGNAIFTSRTFHIRDVANQPGGPSAGTCATCRNAPLAGTSLTPVAMDTGTAVFSPSYPHPPYAQDLPLFKLTCRASAAPHPFIGSVVYTTDPGRALVTGKCADIGSIVPQQFRGLAARAPYFSNGSARTLREVVDFYDTRFAMHLTEADKQDLTNFLSVL
jgi:hypothetical protein